MKAVVISVSLRALPTASPIILAGFCCYSPSSRSPLPSPIQMPPAQATVPPLALPSRPLVGGHRCSLLLEAPTLLSAQPSVPLWEFPVSARPGAPDLMCILAPLLLSPTRPSGASSQTLPLPRGPGLLAPSHLLGGAPPLLPCEPPLPPCPSLLLLPEGLNLRPPRGAVYPARFGLIRCPLSPTTPCQPALALWCQQPFRHLGLKGQCRLPRQGRSLPSSPQAACPGDSSRTSPLLRQCSVRILAGTAVLTQAFLPPCQMLGKEQCLRLTHLHPVLQTGGL